jgi:hypothetical protein
MRLYVWLARGASNAAHRLRVLEVFKWMVNEGDSMKSQLVVEGIVEAMLESVTKMERDDIPSPLLHTYRGSVAFLIYGVPSSLRTKNANMVTCWMSLKKKHVP